MKLSPGQLKTFWSAFAKACEHMAIPPEGRDEYRHRLISEETGRGSLTLVGRTSEFDAIMLRLATDAEDWDAVAKFSCAGEKRVATMVSEAVRQVLELQSIFHHEHNNPAAGIVVTTADEYIRGVCIHAGIPIRGESEAFWLDIPHGDLVRIYQMMDTHRRRLLKRLDWKGPLAFDVLDSWIMGAGGLIRRDKTQETEIWIQVS